MSQFIVNDTDLIGIADALRNVLGPTPKGKNLYDPVLKKARLTPGEIYTVSMDITWDGTHSSAVSHYLRYKNYSSVVHEQNRIVLESAPEAGTTSRHSYQLTLTSKDVCEIRNIYAGYEDTITIANIQVELGSTATAYEAYDGHILFPTGFENLIQNDLVQKILNGVYTTNFSASLIKSGIEISIKDEAGNTLTSVTGSYTGDNWIHRQVAGPKSTTTVSAHSYYKIADLTGSNYGCILNYIQEIHDTGEYTYLWPNNGLVSAYFINSSNSTVVLQAGTVIIDYQTRH